MAGTTDEGEAMVVEMAVEMVVATESGSATVLGSGSKPPLPGTVDPSVDPSAPIGVRPSSANCASNVLSPLRWSRASAMPVPHSW